MTRTAHIYHLFLRKIRDVHTAWFATYKRIQGSPRAPEEGESFHGEVAEFRYVPLWLLNVNEENHVKVQTSAMQRSMSSSIKNYGIKTAIMVHKDPDSPGAVQEFLVLDGYYRVAALKSLWEQGYYFSDIVVGIVNSPSKEKLLRLTIQMNQMEI